MELERGTQGLVCGGQRELSEVFKRGRDVLRCASGETVLVAMRKKCWRRRRRLGSCDSISGSGPSSSDGAEKEPARVGDMGSAECHVSWVRGDRKAGRLQGV